MIKINRKWVRLNLHSISIKSYPNSKNTKQETTKIIGNRNKIKFSIYLVQLFNYNQFIFRFDGLSVGL